MTDQITQPTNLNGVDRDALTTALFDASNCNNDSSARAKAFMMVADAIKPFMAFGTRCKIAGNPYGADAEFAFTGITFNAEGLVASFLQADGSPAEILLSDAAAVAAIVPIN